MPDCANSLLLTRQTSIKGGSFSNTLGSSTTGNLINMEGCQDIRRLNTKKHACFLATAIASHLQKHHRHLLQHQPLLELREAKGRGK
jgi:hypothetical protein